MPTNDRTNAGSRVVLVHDEYRRVGVGGDLAADRTAEQPGQHPVTA